MKAAVDAAPTAHAMNEAGAPTAAPPTQPPSSGLSLGMPALPPVNYSSPLVAANAPSGPLNGVQEQATANDTAPFNLNRLASALATDASTSAESLRKISSAPHSMHELGVSLTSPKARGFGGGPAGTGGPMRRVSTSTSSLSMRRASSFLWSMDVHRDFESAVQALIAQGREISDVTPAEVLSLMNYSGAEGLTEASVQRHLQKRAALQHKLRAMLPPPPEMARPRAPAMDTSPVASRQADGPGAPKPPNAHVSAATASLSEAMQRQQAVRRQMLDQQRVMQMQALDAPLATST